jgi:hypothetical protein
LINPLVFPIPLFTTVFIGLCWLDFRTAVRVIGAFAGLFFALWIIAEPALYYRFSLYFVPAVIMGGGLLVERLVRWRTASRIAVAGLGALCLLLFGADCLYSLDAARYVVTRDTARYHAYTWYYPVYDWANRHTAPDARFLVIVLSGHSYYLDRPYRRADPWLSGVVNWKTVDTGAELVEFLTKGGYDYVIYDQRDWSQFHGGAEMAKAIDDAIARHLLEPVASFDLRLATGRVRRTFESTRAVILARDATSR